MSDKMNPQIRTVNIGVRELRPIKIYPLSMADQTAMVDLIKGVLLRVFERQEESDANDMQLAELVIKEIKENLTTLLKYVAADEEVTLEELTNYQFTEIVGHVYKDNFEDAGKNVKSLVEKMKKVFNFTRS